MSKTILVVDDDPIMCQSYAEILNEDNYTVETRRNAQAALVALDEGLRVDLVITDYNMPGMDGLELAALVKRNHPHIPVIMCSLYTRTDVYLKALDLGIVEYLEKPAGLKQLKRVVAIALEVPVKGPKNG